MASDDRRDLQSDDDERSNLLRLLHVFAPGATDIAAFARFIADVGEHGLVEARALVEGALDHSSPVIRYQALSTIGYDWGATSRSDRVLEMLDDPDRDCRRQAVGVVGSLWSGTKNRRVMGELLRRVESDAEWPDVRAFAFVELLNVAGVLRSEQPDPLSVVVGPDEVHTARQLATVDTV